MAGESRVVVVAVKDVFRLAVADVENGACGFQLPFCEVALVTQVGGEVVLYGTAVVAEPREGHRLRLRGGRYGMDGIVGESAAVGLVPPEHRFHAMAPGNLVFGAEVERVIVVPRGHGGAGALDVPV